MVNFVIQLDAIITAVLASTVITWCWYSSFLFGKPWRKLTGRSEKQVQKGMGVAYTTWFVASIVMAFILDNILVWVGADTVQAGLLVGFWIWLGFVVTAMTVNNVFSGRSQSLLWIDAAHQLLTILVMGAILSVWI